VETLVKEKNRDPKKATDEQFITNNLQLAAKYSVI
jgi:hypothetical protein